MKNYVRTAGYYMPLPNGQNFGFGSILELTRKDGQVDYVVCSMSPMGGETRASIQCLIDIEDCNYDTLYGCTITKEQLSSLSGMSKATVDSLYSEPKSLYVLERELEFMIPINRITKVLYTGDKDNNIYTIPAVRDQIDELNESLWQDDDTPIDDNKIVKSTTEGRIRHYIRQEVVQEYYELDEEELDNISEYVIEKNDELLNRLSKK